MTKLGPVLGQPCLEARQAGWLAPGRQQILHKPLDLLFGKDHVPDSEPDHLQPTQNGPWRQPDHRGPAADRPPDQVHELVEAVDTIITSDILRPAGTCARLL